MALECSPSDELTKLPLLCVPHEDAAFVLKGFRPNGGFFDWDHLYRPKNDSLLTGTLGGQAVRQARVQLLHRTEQHEPKDENLNGPMLPATPEEQFQAVFFFCYGLRATASVRLLDGRSTRCHAFEFATETIAHKR